MPISVRHIEFHVLNMRTRMPFNYGIASLTALPHLFVRATVDIDGVETVGLSSEGLPPKWFTKDPETTFEQDLGAMLRVIRHAADAAVELGPSEALFALWQALHHAQADWGQAEGLPPLLTGFGTSLTERAVIDAACRHWGVSFREALRENRFGIRLRAIHRELGDAVPSELLSPAPDGTVIVRHTVGLADPLTDGDLSPGGRLDDGLPQSLEANLGAYGLTHLKIKLCGDAEVDLTRIASIARLVELRGAPVQFTVDGNEQYRDVETFRCVWEAIRGNASLDEFMSGLLFVEQPFHRDVALSPQLMADLTGWEGRPPMIIDESDGELDATSRALDGGFAGTSHKNCKGVFKGIANACLVEHRRRKGADPAPVISGEDLAGVGPVAMLQDLAVVHALGIRHAERNGHHYFAGLSMYSEDVQGSVISAHPDLYRRHDLGFATLDVRNGSICVDSVRNAPFGCGLVLDSGRFTPLEDWQEESLGETT